MTLEPVPGLYATGEVCEWNCASGWTVLSAVTIGRIAGQNAARKVLLRKTIRFARAPVGTRSRGFREKGAHPLRAPFSLCCATCEVPSAGSIPLCDSVFDVAFRAPWDDLFS